MKTHFRLQLYVIKIASTRISGFCMFWHTTKTNTKKCCSLYAFDRTTNAKTAKNWHSADCATRVYAARSTVVWKLNWNALSNNATHLTLKSAYGGWYDAENNKLTVPFLFFHCVRSTHTHTHMRLVMRKQWRVTRHVCARRTSNNDVPECDWATLACVRACVLCSIHDCIRIALKSSILTLFEMHVCAFFRVKSIVVGACARCGSGRYCLGINCSCFLLLFALSFSLRSLELRAIQCCLHFSIALFDAIEFLFVHFGYYALLRLRLRFFCCGPVRCPA